MAHLTNALKGRFAIGRHLRAWVLGILCLLVCLPAASADQGEWKLSGRLGLATLSVTEEGAEEARGNVILPTVEFGALYALTDFWQLGLSIGGGPEFLESTIAPALWAQIDGRFIIDALTWVPYLAFGAGAFFRQDVSEDGRSWRFDPSIYGGFGIDYRPARSWSVGLLARGHMILTDLGRTSGPFDAQLTFSAYLD